VVNKIAEVVEQHRHWDSMPSHHNEPCVANKPSAVQRHRSKIKRDTLPTSQVWIQSVKIQRRSLDIHDPRYQVSHKSFCQTVGLSACGSCSVPNRHR
jgi:hypothetical protein